MTFDGRNWSRWSGSANFDAPVEWAYRSTTDTLAAIVASGYFNDKSLQLKIGDAIWVVAADDIQEVRVTAVTPNVTVTQFSEVVDDASLDGTQAATKGSGNVIGALTLTHIINTPGGATGDTDITITYKSRVIDVLVVNDDPGTALDTITVKNGASDITDAMDISGAMSTVQRSSELKNIIIAAGGTLRVTETDGGGNDSPATTVYVTVVRTP